MLKSREKGRNEIQRTENDHRKMWASCHGDPQGRWLLEGPLGGRGFCWRSLSWRGLCSSFGGGLWSDYLYLCNISAGNTLASLFSLVTPKTSPLTSLQAPSYTSPKLSPTQPLTGVKWRTTSIAKNQSLPLLLPQVLQQPLHPLEQVQVLPRLKVF